MARSARPALTSRRDLLLVTAAAATAFSSARPAAASFGSSRAAVTSPPNLRQGVALEDFEALTPSKQAQVESALLPSQAEQFLTELKKQGVELESRIEGLLKDISKDRSVDPFDVRVQKAEETIARLEAELKTLEGEPVTRPRSEKEIFAEKEQLERSLARLLQDRADADAADRAEREAQELAVQAARQELVRKQELEARIAQRAATFSALQAQPDWFNYVAAFAASVVSTSIMHPLVSETGLDPSPCYGPCACCSRRLNPTPSVRTRSRFRR